MPHIVIEYAENEIISGKIDKLLDDIVQLADRSEAIDVNNLKLRAIPYRRHRVGGKSDPFVHVAVTLMEGRSRAVLDGLIADLHSLVADRLDQVRQVTLELWEIDPQNYRKN